jgi:hypothetical protein
MKMKQTECSETSEYKIKTPGNYPEESIQSLEHGKSSKSRTKSLLGTAGIYDLLICKGSGELSLLDDFPVLVMKSHCIFCLLGCDAGDETVGCQHFG